VIGWLGTACILLSLWLYPRSSWSAPLVGLLGSALWIVEGMLLGPLWSIIAVNAATGAIHCGNLWREWRRECKTR